MSTTKMVNARALTVLGVVVLVTVPAVLAWGQRMSLQSARSTYQTKLSQLESMQADARRLDLLRTSPQRATDRRLPHEQLAAEIEEACKRASIPTTALVSVWPEAPKRLAQSDYQELTTRLGVEQVNLQQMVAFVHHLLAIDSSLSLAEIRLTSRKGEGTNWDVELAVSYLVFAPGPSRTAP